MSLFREGLQVRQGYKIAQGIPRDAELLGVTYNPINHGVIFLITSDSFRDVPAGEDLPIVEMQLRLKDLD